MRVEELCRDDRSTVGLWTRSYARLFGGQKRDPVAEGAVHALLSRMRSCAERANIFACFEANAASDFALLGSLLRSEAATSELFWRVREASFHLRWIELGGR